MTRWEIQFEVMRDRIRLVLWKKQESHRLVESIVELPYQAGVGRRLMKSTNHLTDEEVRFLPEQLEAAKDFVKKARTRNSIAQRIIEFAWEQAHGKDRVHAEG